MTSFQLYSAREHGVLPTVCATLATLGYRAVEGYGAQLEDGEALRRALDASGLAMPSCHVGLDRLEADPAGTAALLASLGVRRAFAPYLAADDRPANADGWRAFARRLAAVQPRLAEAGIAFGWHNHDFEFEALPDGTVPMTLILDTAPALDWEADLAWIARAGADPLVWLDAHADRVTAVHVKDLAPAGERADEDGWADPGEGTMNWGGLFERLRADGRERLLVAEHDRPSDLERFARTALRFVERHADGASA